LLNQYNHPSLLKRYRVMGIFSLPFLKKNLSEQNDLALPSVISGEMYILIN
jgi:hypothetical protein